MEGENGAGVVVQPPWRIPSGGGGEAEVVPKGLEAVDAAGELRAVVAPSLPPPPSPSIPSPLPSSSEDMNK